jgi:hypothetical protein
MMGGALRRPSSFRFYEFRQVLAQNKLPKFIRFRPCGAKPYKFGLGINYAEVLTCSIFCLIETQSFVKVIG